MTTTLLLHFQAWFAAGDVVNTTYSPRCCSEESCHLQVSLWFESDSFMLEQQGRLHVDNWVHVDVDGDATQVLFACVNVSCRKGCVVSPTLLCQQATQGLVMELGTLAVFEGMVKPSIDISGVNKSNTLSSYAITHYVLSNTTTSMVELFQAQSTSLSFLAVSLNVLLSSTLMMNGAFSASFLSCLICVLFVISAMADDSSELNNASPCHHHHRRRRYRYRHGGHRHQASISWHNEWMKPLPSHIATSHQHRQHASSSSPSIMPLPFVACTNNMFMDVQHPSWHALFGSLFSSPVIDNTNSSSSCNEMATHQPPVENKLILRKERMAIGALQCVVQLQVDIVNSLNEHNIGPFLAMLAQEQKLIESNFEFRAKLLRRLVVDDDVGDEVL